MSEVGPEPAEQEPLTRISAPFTPEQVEALNQYQTRGKFHPFTCGNDIVHNHPPKESWEDNKLVATTEGWICPDELCDYTQNWAWDFMTYPEMISPPETSESD